MGTNTVSFLAFRRLKWSIPLSLRNNHSRCLWTLLLSPSRDSCKQHHLICSKSLLEEPLLSFFHLAFCGSMLFQVCLTGYCFAVFGFFLFVCFSWNIYAQGFPLQRTSDKKWTAMGVENSVEKWALEHNMLNLARLKGGSRYFYLIPVVVEPWFLSWKVHNDSIILHSQQQTFTMKTVHSGMVKVRTDFWYALLPRISNPSIFHNSNINMCVTKSCFNTKVVFTSHRQQISSL